MQITRTSIHRLLLYLVAFAVAVAVCLLAATAGAAPRKNLLIFNSYTPGYKWTDDINAGIADAIHRAGDSVSIHKDFMDTKRVADAEYFHLLYQAYRYEFRNSRFDAIIATDNDAFDFLLQYRDQIFPGTPVVFCGVNDFQPSQLHGAKMFTGVNEAADFKATIDLALKLHPDTRQIVVINDTTTTGRTVHNQLMQLLPAYRDKVTFRMLEDVDMPEILSAVRGLKRGTIVFYTFFSRDKAGRFFDSDQSISMISGACPVPIYGAWDFNLGYGIVGGMLTSGYSQGRTAGALALRVLRGESPDRIPVVMKSPNRYMFDYRQLQRFDIKEKLLPRDSIIINRPAVIYAVNRSAILAAAAALIALVLIIVVLLRNIAIRKGAEEALSKNEENLRRLNEELEERVQERTRELKEQNRLLQTETEDRIRVMEELRVKDQLLIHQSRMAAMGEMLGNIAHQWRQPLNLLGLHIQDLGLSYKLGHFTGELLGENVSKCMKILSHLSKTIDDFRTFSTPDKQKVLFKVHEVIAKTISLTDEAFKSQGITIETMIEGEPEINGYPNEYAQVLLNLLINSKDAFQEREIVDGRITLRVRSAEGRAEVTVSDNAGGIDEAIMGRIFEPYFTTKGAGKGTGVGLFMSKVIIEQNMGGFLEARNIEGGIEFVITVEEARAAPPGNDHLVATITNMK